MSSRRGSGPGRRGVRDLVRPAYLHTPSTAVGTDGDLVEQFGKTIGRDHDPEQMLAINALMSVDADGTHSAVIGAIVCARQNLKTYSMESIALTKLFVMKSELIIWSAHEISTAMASFRTFVDYCENYDALRRRVKHVWRDTNNERIEMVDGRELRIKARTKGGARGLAGPDVFLDEAYAVKPYHLGAIMPVMSAQPNPHLILGSSAGQLDSEALRDIRDQGRAGSDEVAYAEWCAPGSFAEPGCADKRCDHKFGSEGCSLDRQDYLMMANPAKDRRIGRKYLRAERKALPPAEYARERLGWWDEPLTSLPIPLDRFLAALDQVGRPVEPWKGRVVMAAEVDVDRGSGAIAVAGWNDDGLPVAGLIDVRAGVTWMAPRLKTLVKKHAPVAVLVNDTGPAGSLIDACAKENIEVTKLSGSDMAKAAGGLYSKTVDEVDPQWRFWDPVPEGEKFGEIVKALRGSTKRKVGDAWAFDRRGSSVPISALSAISMVVQGMDRIPVEPVALVAWS